MKRPTVEKGIVDEAARRFIKKVPFGSNLSESDVEGFVEDVKKMNIRSHHLTHNYMDVDFGSILEEWCLLTSEEGEEVRDARSSSDDGYECSQLDILESCVEEVLHEAITKWIIHCGIKPKYKIGDVVVIRLPVKGVGFKHGLGTVAEVMKENSRKPGYYAVKPDSLTEEEKKRELRYLFEWEDVERITDEKKDQLT